MQFALHFCCHNAVSIALLLLIMHFTLQYTIIMHFWNESAIWITKVHYTNVLLNANCIMHNALPTANCIETNALCIMFFDHNALPNHFALRFFENYSWLWLNSPNTFPFESLTWQSKVVNIMVELCFGSWCMWNMWDLGRLILNCVLLNVAHIIVSEDFDFICMFLMFLSMWNMFWFFMFKEMWQKLCFENILIVWSWAMFLYMCGVCFGFWRSWTCVPNTLLVLKPHSVRDL